LKKEDELDQQEYTEEKVITNFNNVHINSNSNLIFVYFFNLNLVPKSKMKSRNSAPNSKKEAKQPPKGKEARKWDDQYEEANAKNIDFYDK